MIGYAAIKRCAARLRTLVVEDHAPTAAAMQRLLEEEGFATKAAGSYRDALAIATDWLPDLLISDIHLPDRDGLEVIKALRQFHPQLRGIVVSSYASAQDVQRSREAGFSEYLSKPITLDRLMAAVKRVLVNDLATEAPSAHAEASS